MSQAVVTYWTVLERYGHVVTYGLKQLCDILDGLAVTSML